NRLASVKVGRSPFLNYRQTPHNRTKSPRTEVTCCPSSLIHLQLTHDDRVRIRHKDVRVTEQNRIELTVKGRKAVLVAVLLAGTDQRKEKAPLEELCGLAKTAGANIVGTLVQNRQRPTATTYLG